MGWKYIMLTTRVGGLEYEFPVIFSDKMVHKDVAIGLRMFTPGGDKGDWSIPTSAGTIGQLFVKGVGGSSETLDLESFGVEDEETINNYNYRHGIKI